MPPRGDLQLAIGYWVVSHKATLKTWWAILLMAIIFLSSLWLVISLTIFFAQENKVNDRVLSMVSGIRALSPTALGQPTTLSRGVVTAIDRGDGRYDLVADLHNANKEWGATDVQVHFVSGGQNLPSLTTFVNANSTRPVIMLNQKMELTSSISLAIDHVTWVRDQSATAASSFPVTELTIEPTSVTIGSRRLTTATVKAKIDNRSVYNYYHITVPIIVRAGETIVAVDELSYDRWATMSQRIVDVTWPYPVGGATTADILPQVSRYDLANRY